MYRERTKYAFESCHWVSMALLSTVDQKTKKWRSEFVKHQKLRRSDLMEGADHTKYHNGHKT